MYLSLCLKNVWMGQTQGIILLFCSLSVLIFGGSTVLASNRKSYLAPAETVSCVCLNFFKDSERNPFGKKKS